MKIPFLCLLFALSFSWLSAQKTSHKHLVFKTIKPEKIIHTGWKGFDGSYPIIDLDDIESYFSYIPATSYTMPDASIITTPGFFMLRFEVPNMLYRMFITNLQAQGKTEELKTALPDTNAWSGGLQPYAERYFSDRAFNAYPVVQVSRAGIHLFCTWLKDQLPSVKLKKWKDKKIEFRLPSEAEWMVAASGGDTNAVYAWKGSYLKTTLKDFEGDYIANFRRVSDDLIIRDEKGALVVGPRDKNTVPSEYINMNITIPVISYWPNNYGLYNMCGNVREMVQEEGFTKGGGWIDPGGELKIAFRNTYQKQGSPCEGFRIIAIVE